MAKSLSEAYKNPSAAARGGLNYAAPDRDDISTWFDWLELDDYVTYGGKP